MGKRSRRAPALTAAAMVIPPCELVGRAKLVPATAGTKRARASCGGHASLCPPYATLLRRHPLREAATHLHHHLDGIVDAFTRVFDRGRQIFERKRVGMQ